jgi:hypothetical protein
VLPTQVEDRLQSHAAIQVAMEVDQLQILIDHYRELRCLVFDKQALLVRLNIRKHFHR